MAQYGKLRFPAMDMNKSIMSAKMDAVYGTGCSVLRGLSTATDIHLMGRLVCCCGFGNVGKSISNAMSARGARVLVSEVDPICALQAVMAGYQVLTVPEAIAAGANVFVTCTGNDCVLTVEIMLQMANGTILLNAGHSCNEIDVQGMRKVPGIVVEPVKANVEKFVRSDGTFVVILAGGAPINQCASPGSPSFVSSCKLSYHAVALLELWTSRPAEEPEVKPRIVRKGKQAEEPVVEPKYANKLYSLPKQIDEKVTCYDTYVSIRYE